jgi:hypothetical protein
MKIKYKVITYFWALLLLNIKKYEIGYVKEKACNLPKQFLIVF